MYTNSQLFWIGYAQVWCTKQTPQAIANDIESGLHSIPKYRVNGAVNVRCVRVQ